MVAVGEPGERVLHLQCGAGGLTKLLASQGLTVVGADTEVDAALARGLTAKKYLGEPLSRMSLGSASGSEGFDVVFYYGSDDHESRRVASLLARDAAAEELWRVVKLQPSQGAASCLCSPRPRPAPSLGTAPS
uniref:Uncharacterized protein n=1 Tax=Tetraselmis sp. GSL018 TaxID=582737 RepID=A0A061QR61_9CHLO